MVRYYFSCINKHIFDMWFKNIAFFEEQYKTKVNIACPICGSTNVTKKIMAPSIIKGKSKAKSKSNSKYASPLTTDVEKLNKQFANFKKYIKKNFVYVGKDFKNVAIKMHKGEMEKNNIYGEANKEEIIELNKEGVDVLAFDINIDSKKIN